VTAPPEQLVTVVPADVAVILLVKAGLDGYRRAHRGENPRVDRVLIELTEAAIRWRELSARGQNRAPNADIVPSLQERLTTKQVADLTGVSSRTVRRAIAAGHLPAQRLGRLYVIDRRDVGHYHTTREGQGKRWAVPHRGRESTPNNASKPTESVSDSARK
jgi:excisionase family DNA binding protein